MDLPGAKGEFRENEEAFSSYHKRIIDTSELLPFKKFRETCSVQMGKAPWSSEDREDWRYTSSDLFYPDFTLESGSYKTSITGLTEKDIRSGVRAIKDPEKMNEVVSFIQENKETSFLRDKWTLLNAAFFSGGVFLNIPKDYKAEGIIYLHHDFTGYGPEFPLTYIKLDRGSELNIVEEYKGDERGAKTVISSTIIELEADSKLNHVFIQNLSPESKGLFYQKTGIGRDAFFQTHSVQLGSKLARVIQKIKLNAPGGYFKNFGLLYGRNKQHLDIQADQIHSAPHTGGEVLHRHALTDSAKSIFKGKIVIEKGKTFCNSTQKNENLLLSPKAMAISLPKLEIENNEVQCSHGATISSIDEDQLFYLTSRGIEINDARKMIVEGFFDEVIEKSTVEGLKKIISKKIKEAL